MIGTGRHQKGYIFRKGNGWYLRYYDFVAAPGGELLTEGEVQEAGRLRTLIQVEDVRKIVG